MPFQFATTESFNRCTATVHAKGYQYQCSIYTSSGVLTASQPADNLAPKFHFEDYFLRPLLIPQLSWKKKGSEMKICTIEVLGNALQINACGRVKEVRLNRGSSWIEMQSQEGLSQSMGSSGVAMDLQSCPTLGQKGQAFTPPHRIGIGCRLILKKMQDFEESRSVGSQQCLERLSCNQF